MVVKHRNNGFLRLNTTVLKFRTAWKIASSSNCLEADDMAHQRMMEYCILYMGNELAKKWDYRLQLSYICTDDTEDLSYLPNVSWETCIRFWSVYQVSIHTWVFFYHVIYKVGNFMLRVMLTLSHCTDLLHKAISDTPSVFHNVCYLLVLSTSFNLIRKTHQQAD